MRQGGRPTYVEVKPFNPHAANALATADAISQLSWPGRGLGVPPENPAQQCAPPHNLTLRNLHQHFQHSTRIGEEGLA
jgi:hypothetical protein